MSNRVGSERRTVRPGNYSSKRHYGKQPITWHNSYPGFNLNSYDQSAMSSRWQYSNRPIHYEPGYRLPQAVNTGFAPFQFRSSEELQTERSYLINSLQREDLKAMDLLKKIRFLQGNSQETVLGLVNRKLKRQLGHLKSRMCQCTKQEKAILARLGHVTYEIQSRERWSRIENERLQQQWNCQGLEQLSLDPINPQTIPHVGYPQQWPTQPLNYCFYPGVCPQSMHSDQYFPEWQLPQICHDSNEPYELQDVSCMGGSPIYTRIRSASMTNLALPATKVKRLSMPELSMVIVDEDALGAVDDKQYVGYYVNVPAR